MKKVGTDDIVEFKGDFYKIPKSINDPKPIQKPHPNILLDGFSPKTFERMVKYDYCDIRDLLGSFEYSQLIKCLMSLLKVQDQEWTLIYYPNASIYYK